MLTMMMLVLNAFAAPPSPPTSAYVGEWYGEAVGRATYPDHGAFVDLNGPLALNGSAAWTYGAVECESTLQFDSVTADGFRRFRDTPTEFSPCYAGWVEVKYISVPGFGRALAFRWLNDLALETQGVLYPVL